MKNLVLNNALNGEFKPVKDDDGTASGLSLAQGKVKIDDLEVRNLSGSINFNEDLNIASSDDIILDPASGDVNILNTAGAGKKPTLFLKNTDNDAFSANMIFLKDRGAVGQDDDMIGIIKFNSFTSNLISGALTYASITASIEDATSASAGGKLRFQVVAHDGELVDALTLTDGDAEDEIDVNIASGTSSVTAVAGHLTTAGNITIPADTKIYLDGGGDTYISEVGADAVRFYVGNHQAMNITTADDGSGSNNITDIWMRESSVHFSQITEGFSTDELANSGSGTSGTHDTDIDFRASNKIRLDILDNMNDMNLIFPAGAGNFTLFVTYNGNWAIDSWKVWKQDASAAGAPNVFWPGGTEPDTTNGGADIFSFYWTGTDGGEYCFGVASLDFQAGD